MEERILTALSNANLSINSQSAEEIAKLWIMFKYFDLACMMVICLVCIFTVYKVIKILNETTKRF